MRIDKTEELQKLEAAYEFELSVPFPYEDITKLQALDPVLYRNLSPDLDVFLSKIYGAASRARRLQFKTVEELLIIQKELGKSFFELYPEYPTELLATVNQLRVALERAEAIRLKLLSVIAML